MTELRSYLVYFVTKILARKLGVYHKADIRIVPFNATLIAYRLTGTTTSN